jgi:hypothetical protein
MDIKAYKTPFEYIVVDNFYTEQELLVIKTEVNALMPFIFDGSKEAGSAAGKKTGHGIFLDDYYGENRNLSAVLNINRKIFDQNIIAAGLQVTAFFGHLKHCTDDATLLNVYKELEKYDAHTDTCVLTGVTNINKNYEGGNLFFPDYNLVVEAFENRLTIFPSCVNHAVEPVTSKTGCRITITQFLSYK